MHPKKALAGCLGSLALAAVLAGTGLYVGFQKLRDYDWYAARLEGFDPHFWTLKAFDNEMPAGLSVVDGAGHTWQGESLFIILRVNKADLREHLESKNWNRERVQDEDLNHWAITDELQRYLDTPWQPEVVVDEPVYVKPKENVADKDIRIWIPPSNDDLAFLRFRGS